MHQNRPSVADRKNQYCLEYCIQYPDFTIAPLRPPLRQYSSVAYHPMRHPVCRYLTKAPSWLGKKSTEWEKRVCECETTFVIISNEITCPSSLEIVKFTIIPSNRTERLAGQSSNRNITTNACNKYCAKRPGIQKAATIQQKNSQVHHPAPWLPFPLPVTSSPTWPHFDRTSKTTSTIIISRQHCQKRKIPRAALSGKIQSKSAQD